MTEKFQFFLNEREHFFENTMDLNRIQKYDNYYLSGFREINQFQQNLKIFKCYYFVVSQFFLIKLHFVP